MAPRDPADLARDAVTASLRAHNDTIFTFAKALYSSHYTFECTRFLGHQACKIPSDLWIMHDLFCQFRFETVIETGTADGGATLWYATLMDLLKIERGHIWSIDTQPNASRPDHRRITYITGSSTDEQIVKLWQTATDAQPLGPMLLNLDSDHTAPHVRRELDLWAPLVPVGSWLVVEDTNGAPIVKDEAGQPIQVEGPLAGLFEYLEAHPGEWQREIFCERYLLTMNPGGWLQRKASYVETR